MKGKALTRRGFLAVGAGAAAVVSAGALTSTGCQALPAASADSAGAAGKSTAGTQSVNTLCAGCANHCGLTAYVQDGKLKRVVGIKEHPFTGGYLCGRGQGYAHIAYGDNRVQQPLKADGKGGFSPVAWDDALFDIASQMKKAGPAKTGLFQDGRGTDSYYTERLMAAFGSANYYSDSALNDVDISTVIMPVLGAFPAPDAAPSKCIVLLDKASYEGVRPYEIAATQQAKANGAKVYVVDPRLCSYGSLAAQWVPIKPGSELAFLLGVSSYLVEKGRYDKAFVDANGHGFEGYAEALKAYPLSWASDKTGAPQDKLEEVALALADAAPHCYVDLQWAGTVGSGYANSAEQLRALLLLNALLGNLNQPGGLIFPVAPFLGPDALDQSVFIPTPRISTPPAGEGDFSLSHTTSCQAGLRAGLDAALFVECDPLSDWPDSAGTEAALKAIPLKVAIDSFMTPTAQACDYVLPTHTYLERPGIVDTAKAESSFVTIRNKVIEPVCPQAKSIYEIVEGLADPLGVKQYFAFTLDDYNLALCKAYDVSYDDLRREAVVPLAHASVTYGKMPYMMSASKKVEFTCEAFAKAGRSATPTWIEPAVQPTDDEARLITGDQFTQVRSYTLDAPQLLEDARENHMDYAWIHPDRAQQAGIAEGDRVRLTSKTGDTVATAKVTDKVHADAVYLPTHYGRAGLGFGARWQNLVPCQYEPGTGAAMSNEVLVSLHKEGA